MRRLALLSTVILVAALLVLSQLLLPGIAARRLRDQLSRSGQVTAVEVHAFPALKLLWRHADRVVIRMQSYATSSSGELGTNLNQIGGVGSLDASAAEVRAAQAG